MSNIARMPVGIKSLAVNLPSVLRTNDYFVKHYPEVVSRVEQSSLAKAFRPAEIAGVDRYDDIWSKEMRPYLTDPFRGAKERRVLGPGESSLTLERGAAERALRAADLTPEGIDALMTVSMFPDPPGHGNAVVLAGALGMRCGASSLNAHCGGALVALQHATALVRTGECQNVLVATSGTYSRMAAENDSLAFTFGDGASAFVVGAVEEDQGVLSTHVMNMAETCGFFHREQMSDGLGRVREVLRFTGNTTQNVGGLIMKYTSLSCEAALAKAGVSRDQIKLFVCFTGVAWYARAFARVLGVDPEHVVDLYSQHGNVSAATALVSLHHAAATGRLRPGDLVLVSSYGVAGSAAAAVMRWGDVKLGPPPDPPRLKDPAPSRETVAPEPRNS